MVMRKKLLVVYSLLYVCENKVADAVFYKGL